MTKSLLSVMILFALTSVLGCGGSDKKADDGKEALVADAVIEKYSLKQLEAAALVFRVAFDRSLDSWQGPTDQAVPGCKISGKEAETGLAALKPWIDKKATEEAKRLLDSPKNYRLPVDDQACERECECGAGLRILEMAKLDEESHSKVKEWKRARVRLNAKAELVTREKAELCAEGSTWICTSDLLKAVKTATKP